jgi:hypothetical protein
MPKTVYQRKKCPLEIFVGGRHDTNSDAKKSTSDFVTKMYFNEGRQKRGKVDAKGADITFTKGKAELFILNS